MKTSRDLEELAERLFETGVYPETIERYLAQTPFYPAGTHQRGDVFAHASKRVCMLYTSRSGSTYLADALNRTNLFGNIQEYLETPMLCDGLREKQSRSIDDYLRDTVRTTTTSNGVFALKASYGALFPLAVVGEVPNNIDKWDWISVQRRDLVAQAVSLYRARRTQVWHRRTNAKRRTPTPPYDFDGIERCYTAIVRAQGQTEFFINRHNINVLRVYYEDIDTDASGVVEDVFKHVGLEFTSRVADDLKSSTFQILRNDRTKSYADRFRQDLINSLLRERKEPTPKRRIKKKTMVKRLIGLFPK